MHRGIDVYELYPLSKKLKYSNTISDPAKSKSNNDDNIPSDSFNMNTNNISQNSSLKACVLSKTPIQPIPAVYPNRKRRYRNTQETSTNPSTSASTTDANGQPRKKSDLSCVVCRAAAHGYNFDAISCESCKAFFRRNALFNADRLKCRRDGTCEITLETRRRCKSCRLKKCFAVGMRKEWILTEEEKLSKKRRIEENRKLRISNITDSVAPDDPMKTNPINLESVLLSKDNLTLRPESSMRNADLISDVAMAYSESIRIDLAGYGWSYQLARKITALCQIINTRNTTALRLISFYKRLQDFDILNEIDKVNLVKNNLQYIFFFHASLKYDPTHDIYHEENTNDKPLYGADIHDAYGIDSYNLCTQIMRSLHSIVQKDKRIMQVALVIFLCSKGLSTTINPNESSLKNPQHVLNMQNKYVEQLWLFIEKLYGAIEAVRIFSILINRCLHIQELIRVIQHDVYEKIDPCQLPPMLWNFTQSA